MFYCFILFMLNIVDFLINTIRHNFPSTQKLVLAGTIQFASAIQLVAQTLKSEYVELYVPQAKPLSRGEVLGKIHRTPIVQH